MSASDQHLLHLIHVVAHQLKTQADRSSIAAAGVSAGQAAVMYVIAKEPGATQKRVAEALHLRESGVTALVGRLIDAGHLSRQQSSDDGRAWTLHLTPRGLKALMTLQETLDEMNKRLDDALGAKGVNDLVRTLNNVRKATLPSG
jgi:MarR family transcriptional regulator, organic hydroperoxide resistance regulator